MQVMFISASAKSCSLDLVVQNQRLLFRYFLSAPRRYDLDSCIRTIVLTLGLDVQQMEG